MFESRPKKADERSFEMKRTVAFILMACVLFTLCSCTLVRKIEPAETKESVKDDGGDTTVETDFSETKEEDTTAQEIRYTEDEALELLVASFGDESAPEITKTGAMIAQSNGTEYYIFDVKYPESAESNTETEAESEGADSESDSEAGEEFPTTIYVSTNGIIYSSLEEANATTVQAGETYLLKHGEKDKTTGFAYRIEYQGLVKNQELFCYNFIVYLEDDSSGTVNSVYKTNYLVTLDGKSSGEQKLQ